MAYATAGRYFVWAGALRSMMTWAWTSEWPAGSFATLATGIWGRYHGRDA